MLKRSVESELANLSPSFGLATTTLPRSPPLSIFKKRPRRREGEEEGEENGDGVSERICILLFFLFFFLPPSHKSH